MCLKIESAWKPLLLGLTFIYPQVKGIFGKMVLLPISSLFSRIHQLTVSGFLSTIVSPYLLPVLPSVTHSRGNVCPHLWLNQFLTLFVPSDLASHPLIQHPPNLLIPLHPPSPDRLPVALANGVRRQVALQLQLPIQALRITSFSRENWTDGCLGLKTSNLCPSVIVPGWRIQLSAAAQNWFYRTDEQGGMIRAERFETMGTLPNGIQNAVLAMASQRTGTLIHELTIGNSRPQRWNHCLGLPSPRETCSLVPTPGWQVVVSNVKQYWVFHVDQDGKRIRLNSTISGYGSIAPEFLTEGSDWLPVNTSPAIVFQSIQMSKASGVTNQFVLQGDGQLLRIKIVGNRYTPAQRIAILSSQQIKQFRDLLTQQQFNEFNEFNFPPTPEAIHDSKVLLFGPQTKLQYSDIQQRQLPTSLQRIVQTWNMLTSLKDEPKT
jgi:hypothetical protein